MTMSREEFHKLIQYKIGEIYIVRKGTAAVYIVDGTTFLVPLTGAVIVNPAKEYWVHAIDWAGGFSDYFTYQMCPPDKLTYDAKPIIPIKPEYLDKLKKWVGYLG